MADSRSQLNLFAYIQIAFASAACLIIGLNTVSLYKEMNLLAQARRQIPYLFMGKKFLGLSEILKNTKYAGYYTDKNLDENRPALQFAQAQYILVPIILDLNNTDHPYVLFDCSSEEIALQKIKEAGLVPAKKNQFGIILTRRLEENQPSRPRLTIPLFPKPE